jgi:methylmalonyl-CoA mutase
MSAALCEASIRQIIEKEDGKRILSSTFPGLNRVRDAGWIESTRASISTQTVFLATLGSESEWKPRATFARNFFAIMGWTVEEYSGLSSIEALTALSTAMVDSGAELCCICGSNERYASELSAVVKALSPLSKLVMLAGKDRDSLVDVELYRGVNIREAWSAILHSTMNGESQ